MSQQNHVFNAVFSEDLKMTTIWISSDSLTLLMILWSMMTSINSSVSCWETFFLNSLTIFQLSLPHSELLNIFNSRRLKYSDCFLTNYITHLLLGNYILRCSTSCFDFFGVFCHCPDWITPTNWKQIQCIEHSQSSMFPVVMAAVWSMLFQEVLEGIPSNLALIPTLTEDKLI